MQYRKPVEAIPEFHKIIWQMFCDDGMIGSVNSVFHIANYGFEPLKNLSLIVIISIVCANLFILVHCLRDTTGIRKGN